MGQEKKKEKNTFLILFFPGRVEPLERINWDIVCFGWFYRIIQTEGHTQLRTPLLLASFSCQFVRYRYPSWKCRQQNVSHSGANKLGGWTTRLTFFFLLFDLFCWGIDGRNQLARSSGPDLLFSEFFKKSTRPEIYLNTMGKQQKKKK